MRGYWNMPCWNGLSRDQQRRLIEVGNLPWGYEPEGECQRGAELEITTMYDVAPGPRFYCGPCAIKFLTSMVLNNDTDGVG
jgi:hypothetical protein